MSDSRLLLGRRKILIDDVDITADNVIKILLKTMEIHSINSSEIDYLYNYRKGRQPILDRVKEVRSEINHKIIENHADEIVSFKTGYLLSNPVVYAAAQSSDRVNDDLVRLNKWMKTEKKITCDKDIETWAHTCGVGIRMILPDSMADVDADDSPFELYSLDPRYAYVAYSNSLGEHPKMGVKYIVREDGIPVFSIYTPTNYYEVCSANVGNILMKNEVNPLGRIPMFEYTINHERMGSFEKVLPLLDAINLTASDRENGLDQFIQSLLLFHNVKISDDEYKALREEGGLQYNDLDDQHKAEVKYLTAELNQSETQTLVDWEYKMVLSICGMPNRNGGSSTSDTGTATIVRDGWYDAEGKAQDAEGRFKDSEMDFLELALYICNTISGTNLNPMDIDIKLPRRIYENIQQKSQVLVTMLNNNKISPRRAYITSGLFTDPEEAYAEGMEYYKQAQAEQQKRMEAQAAVNATANAENNAGGADENNDTA